MLEQFNVFGKQKSQRLLGSAKGKIRIAEDFDAPLSENILKEFWAPKGAKGDEPKGDVLN